MLGSQSKAHPLWSLRLVQSAPPVYSLNLLFAGVAYFLLMVLTTFHLHTSGTSGSSAPLDHEALGGTEPSLVPSCPVSSV